VASLALSTGAAEWLLYRYRGMGLAAMRRSSAAAAFRYRAAASLVACLAGYLAVLAALTVAAGALGNGESLVLGAVLWPALLLQAFGIAWPPAAVCVAAAGLQATHITTQPVTCGCAAAVLVALAAILLGRATAHR
jgi:hypothetical protein